MPSFNAIFHDTSTDNHFNDVQSWLIRSIEVELSLVAKSNELAGEPNG